MKAMLPALALCAVVLTLRHPAAQPAPGDPAEGQRIAQRWCSNCHLADPKAQPNASDATPSFAAIANRSSTTSRSLQDFLLTPHPPMPDFRLSRQQIDDVSAYILSLRRR